jgi:DNA-binding XRE family transcriptional regulator
LDRHVADTDLRLNPDQLAQLHTTYRVSDDIAQALFGHYGREPGYDRLTIRQFFDYLLGNKPSFRHREGRVIGGAPDSGFGRVWDQAWKEEARERLANGETVLDIYNVWRDAGEQGNPPYDTPPYDTIDEWRKGRGLGDNNAVLDWDQVRQIREMAEDGIYTQGDIAQQFGVSGKTISQILNNKSWKDESWNPTGRSYIREQAAEASTSATGAGGAAQYSRFTDPATGREYWVNNETGDSWWV